MSISSINAFRPCSPIKNISFGEENKQPATPTTQAAPTISEADLKIRKIAKGIASAAIPGVSQTIDGRYKDAVNHFGTAAGLFAATTITGTVANHKLRAFNKATFNAIAEGTAVKDVKLSKAVPILGVTTLVLMLCGVANNIRSAIDAYKKG